MRFQLNFKSGKPVYLQLVDQVKVAAASGTVQAGDPLPGIRPLAEELRVNRNTVAKAYAELEGQGVIETIAGKGCFVRPNNSPLKKDVKRKLLAETLEFLASDPELAQRMGQCGRRRVLADYTWPIVAERLLNRIPAL